MREARARAFTTDDPRAAFEHFRALADQVPAGGLEVFKGQPLLMRANVLAALEALGSELPKVVERMTDPPLVAVLELPALVLALSYAVGRVPVASLSAGDIKRMLEEGGPLRELMLDYLKVVSNPLIGLVPNERYRAIRRGSGNLDKAQDFVAIAGLFAEYETALANRHPFSTEQLQRLATLGGALVAQMRPGRARNPVATRGAESLLRDRFARLVADRYDQLQVVAVVALGKRRAEAQVPALHSATSTRTTDAADATPPATPTPAKGT